MPEGVLCTSSVNGEVTLWSLSISKDATVLRAGVTYSLQWVFIQRDQHVT